MSIDRIVAADVMPDEEDDTLQVSLRPQSFADYIGQEKLKTQLSLTIDAAKQRSESVDHVLLYGPPGLGKTSMAHVIGKEMNVSVRITSGPAIERAGDLASILTNLQQNDILFIDEIHRLNKTVEEVLYSAMEDFKLDIMIGKGPSAKSLRLDLPAFTVIGATTKVGSLSAPLRDRFGIVHRLDFYTEEELAKIINRSASILDIKIDPKAVDSLSRRCRLTPRIANRLLKRVRDYAQVHGDGEITNVIADQALALLEIDEIGLDASDRRILRALVENYGGNPVGLQTLAALTAEEVTTIEDFYEPFLMQVGFIERTPRGRKITPKAQQHINKISN
jgi:Holliday junction DNA helicase RuvB